MPRTIEAQRKMSVSLLPSSIWYLPKCMWSYQKQLPMGITLNDQQLSAKSHIFGAPSRASLYDVNIKFFIRPTDRQSRADVFRKSGQTVFLFSSDQMLFEDNAMLHFNTHACFINLVHVPSEPIRGPWVIQWVRVVCLRYPFEIVAPQPERCGAKDVTILHLSHLAFPQFSNKEHSISIRIFQHISSEKIFHLEPFCIKTF